MILFYSEGGVGDTLQHLPFILANPTANYCFLNHYRGAKELLQSLKIKPKHCLRYKLDEEKVDILKTLNLREPMHAIPRLKYFVENPFPKQKPLFDNDNPVIGVHLNGSQYSTNYHRKLGFATKTIPADIIGELKDYNVIVFGLPEEVTRLGMKPSNNLKFV